MQEKTFERNNRRYTYKEDKYEKSEDGRKLNTTYLSVLPSHEKNLNSDLKRTTKIYVQRRKGGKELERHQEQQTSDITLRTDPTQLNAEVYTDGTATQSNEKELDTLQIEPYRATEFAPTPEERPLEPVKENTENLNQLLEEINILAENIAIHTPELQGSNNEESENSSSEESEESPDSAEEEDFNEAQEQDPRNPEDPEEPETMATAAISSGSKQKLPDPPRFNGTRRQLKSWIHQLDVKINGNIEKFPDANIKISYAFELLEGEALRWAEQYIDKNTGRFTFKEWNETVDNAVTTYDEYADFKRKIREALGDPNPRATAEEAIRTLKQGLDDCTTYYTKFSQYAYELEWDDEAKIAQFKYGLNAKIIEKMIGMENIPHDDFTEFANKCIRLDNEIKSYQQRYNPGTKFQGHRQYNSGTRFQGPRQYNPGTRHQGQSRQNQQAYRTPNWLRQGWAPSTPPRRTWPEKDYKGEKTTSNPYYHGPAPMDIEINNLRKENKCFKCGKQGHYARNCRSANGPQRPESNKTRAGWNGPTQQIKTISRHDQIEALEETTELKEEELNWVTQNPLRSGCYHTTFARDTYGKLYQKFRYNEQEKTRQIRATKQVRFETIKASKKQEQECTADWCKTLGKRWDWGISRMTFGTKCHKACTPFTCQRCGKTREQEQNSDGFIPESLLSKQICSSCSHCEWEEKDTQQRIKTTLSTGKIQKGTRRYIEDIKDLLHTITDPRILARITATIKQVELNEDAELEQMNYEWNNNGETVNQFYVTGTYELKPEACPICYEPGKMQEYISENGRIKGCEECARIWTETTSTTKWLKILPKNEETADQAGSW